MCNYEHLTTKEGFLEIELKGNSEELKKWMIKMDILDKCISENIKKEYNGEIQLIINYLEKYKHGKHI